MQYSIYRKHRFSMYPTMNSWEFCLIENSKLNILNIKALSIWKSSPYIIFKTDLGDILPHSSMSPLYT